MAENSREISGSDTAPALENPNRRRFLKALGGLTASSLLPPFKPLDALASPDEEARLEALRQKSFSEDWPRTFGRRLYTNDELLNQDFTGDADSLFDFALTPEIRITQYFLRNGRQKTIEDAKKLGCIDRITILDQSHPITQLYREGGADLNGEKIPWLEVPEGRSGGIDRDGKKYGGKTETIITVEAYDESSTSFALSEGKKAQDTGYKVDFGQEFKGTVANEMTHEFLPRIYPSLFKPENRKQLIEPFKSFSTVIPGLRFRNNFQAEEFLSDVSHWVTGGVYYRFFGPLYYMDPKGEYWKKIHPLWDPKDNQYWYSYQAQQHAMEQVLKQKGQKGYKAIVDDLIRTAGQTVDSDPAKKAREHFTEKDLASIGQIYRDIGVGLIKKMKPYMQTPR